MYGLGLGEGLSYCSCFWPFKKFIMEKTGKLILIVDDDPTLRRLLDINLDKAGFRTLQAANGVKALELLKDRTPDLIVTDAFMPLLDGYGLIREVRREPELCRIPVIMLTGKDGSEAAADTIRPDDYEKKPFALANLLTKIENLLSKA